MYGANWTIQYLIRDIIIIIITISFSHKHYLVVFHWSLSDSKSPQVSRTLLSILAVLNNVVVWMVSTRPPTSKSSSPFNNSFVTVQNAPITIGIIVTSMFYSFFNSVERLRYLSFIAHSFSFILWSAGTAKRTILHLLFLLLLVIIWSGFLAEIRWSVCMSKSHRSLCVNHTSACKLFVFDGNTWYRMIVSKKTTTLKRMRFPNMLS